MRLRGLLGTLGCRFVPLRKTKPRRPSRGYPAFPQDPGQSVVVHVVQPCFYIQKQGGDLEPGPVQGFNVIGEGEARIVGNEPRERTALVGVQQPSELGCRN